MRHPRVFAFIGLVLSAGLWMGSAQASDLFIGQQVTAVTDAQSVARVRIADVQVLPKQDLWWEFSLLTPDQFSPKAIAFESVTVDVQGERGAIYHASVSRKKQPPDNDLLALTHFTLPAAGDYAVTLAYVQAGKTIAKASLTVTAQSLPASSSSSRNVRASSSSRRSFVRSSQPAYVRSSDSAVASSADSSLIPSPLVASSSSSIATVTNAPSPASASSSSWLGPILLSIVILIGAGIGIWVWHMMRR